jgi:hypothetical protein
MATLAYDRGADILEEHSSVVLLEALPTRKGTLPAGTRGVVHESTVDGSPYLVEFTTPIFHVTEVPGRSLRRG